MNRSKIFVIACLAAGLAFAGTGAGCGLAGFSKRPGQSQASKLSASLGISAFSSTVYPYARTNCVSCHGEIQVPKFANSDVKVAYEAALTVVSLEMPDLSTIVRKVKDGHCGAACTTDGSEMLALIEQWKSISAGGGGGEEIRIGNIMSSAVNVPVPNPALCRTPADHECPSDGLLNGQPCQNRCWTKLRFAASGMRGIDGAVNTAAAPKVARSWFEIDFAYENYKTDSGPASYVLRNPRLITPDGPVYLFDVKLWLNGKYRPELGGAYRKIDTVVDKAIFGAGCTVPPYPTPFEPTSIGASCLPSSQPLFSTAASAAGIIQEKSSLTDPDQIAFSFEYYQEGIAGDCNDLDLFMANVYAPIQRQAVACLDCHKAGGLVSEAGQRFNMDITDVANGPTELARKQAVCKKFLQRSNFQYPDSSPIITQPTQGLNGMPAQPNFSLFAPDWKAWIEREKGLAR